MKVRAKAGDDNLATVYIAENEKGNVIEFAQSLQPPFPREKKWVFLISTLYGCPVKCDFCDAGGFYSGKLSKDEIMFQINYLLKEYDADKFNCEKLKIQFARVGEPSYNEAVIEVLKEIKFNIKKHNLYPSLSTVAPASCALFFEKLAEVKKALYPKTFQLQFSIHSTDAEVRDKIIPVKKWSFKEIADYGEKFYGEGGRKITLNFIYNPDFKSDADVIKKYFSPDKFLIKITPVNPTYKAVSNKLVAGFYYKEDVWFELLRKEGYEVIISVGELEENKIGSNCGQHITNYLRNKEKISESYTYRVVSIG
jgi:23S rRNA (adenine2503-C2)-methyltransferase